MNEDGTLGALADRLLADAQIGHDIRQFGLLERQGFSLANIDKLLYISQSAKTFIESNLDRIASLDRPPVSAAGQNPVIGRWETFETDHRKYILTTLANGRLRALMPLSLNFRQSDDYKSRFGRTVIRGDLWKGFHQDMGNVAKEGGIAFSNGKKPVRLIKQLIRWANNTQDGIILDFFAGSATTAHAVMLATVDDGVNRRYIMVQLDEVPDPASTPEGNSFKTIAALGEERIRRAAAQIKADNAGKPGIDKLDVGFRVLKIDTSNMAEVYYKPDELKQEQLLGQVDNVKPDRTAEDLLFQVLLDWGVDLSLPIVRETIDGREVFFVDGNALAACFAADGSVDEPFVTELAKRKPLRVVFRDAGFASDNARINVEQIFKTLSPDTEVRTL